MFHVALSVLFLQNILKSLMQDFISLTSILCRAGDLFIYLGRIMKQRYFHYVNDSKHALIQMSKLLIPRKPRPFTYQKT